jgi:hypothetical protein
MQILSEDVRKFAPGESAGRDGLGDVGGLGGGVGGEGRQAVVPKREYD